MSETIGKDSNPENHLHTNKEMEIAARFFPFFSASFFLYFSAYPYRPFHKFRASKSTDWSFLSTLNFSIHRFLVTKTFERLCWDSLLSFPFSLSFFCLSLFPSSLLSFFLSFLLSFAVYVYLYIYRSFNLSFFLSFFLPCARQYRPCSPHSLSCGASFSPFIADEIKWKNIDEKQEIYSQSNTLAQTDLRKFFHNVCSLTQLIEWNWPKKLQH